MECEIVLFGDEYEMFCVEYRVLTEVVEELE